MQFVVSLLPICYYNFKVYAYCWQIVIDKSLIYKLCIEYCFACGLCAHQYWIEERLKFCYPFYELGFRRRCHWKLFNLLRQLLLLFFQLKLVRYCLVTLTSKYRGKNPFNIDFVISRHLYMETHWFSKLISLLQWHFSFICQISFVAHNHNSLIPLQTCLILHLLCQLSHFLERFLGSDVIDQHKNSEILCCIHNSIVNCLRSDLFYLDLVLNIFMDPTHIKLLGLAGTSTYHKFADKRCFTHSLRTNHNTT